MVGRGRRPLPASSCPRELVAKDSTGGKQKLGQISKQGDRYLRRILVVGAIAVLQRAHQQPKKYPWLTQLGRPEIHEYSRQSGSHLENPGRKKNLWSF
jgi:transposase